MKTGGSSSQNRRVRAGLGAQTFVGVAVAVGGVSAAVIGFGFVKPVHTVNPAARAAIETVITLSAMLTAGLFVTSLRHDRRVFELLLLCALVAVSLDDFVYRALPAMTRNSGPEFYGVGSLAGVLIVSLAVAAAAFAPHKELVNRRRRLAGSAIVGGGGAVTLAAVLGRLRSPSHATLSQVGIAAAGAHPVTLGLVMTSASVLLASALAFVRRGRRGEARCGLLAGAALLLAASRLQYLSMPAVAVDWVTPRDGLRLGAYAMLLVSAYLRYARIRNARASAAISRERERIARDLHDGLAQDLACIAAQGQRLDAALAPGHPLMIAARNALATSRGVMADLSASSAPTTGDALRLVADEIEHLYGLQVDIRIETGRALAGDGDLDPADREHVVRIAREAMVNAARHGAARHVDVVLQQRGRDLLLLVSDDGRGIEDAPRSGHGSRTMRARAASLGGRLSAHRRAGGGTELKVVVP